MTHLRQIMLEELRRRNYAESTIRSYLHEVEHFSRHFHRSTRSAWSRTHSRVSGSAVHALEAGPEHCDAAAGSPALLLYSGAEARLEHCRDAVSEEGSAPAAVLSQEEVARLIDAAEFPFHRILLMTLYATGARRAEVAHLKISDIDSQRMVIHIRGGKGRKDRDVMLSPKLLDALRVYWRGLKHKPTTGCFPATDGIPQVIRSPPRFSGLPVRTPPNAPGLNTSTFIPTPCATALPRICSKPVPTCAPFRCCSGIATWKRRRSICISPGDISAPPAVRWMHSRFENKESRRRAHEPASSGGGRHRSLCGAVVC